MNSATEDIRVRANGGDYSVAPGTTIAQFVIARGLQPRMVVVERNGEPVTPSAIESTRLDHGDSLEIVRVVAGG